jgi:predicted nuclease of predicted toxin-antitoxin system
VRVLIDENMGSRRLAARLSAAGHDVVSAVDIGLVSASDARVLTRAIGVGRPVLTRDYTDFTDLHELIMAAGGHHPGILVVRFDSDPAHNLTDRAIATALMKLESSGLPVPDQLHVLNQWR